MGQLSSQDEAAIQSLFQKYDEAWARDSATCASLFARGGDLLAMDGELCSSPGQIAEYYERQLKGPYQDLTVRDMEVGPAGGVGNDVALVNITWRLEGFRNTGGDPHEPVRVRATLMLSRNGGEWQIAAARFMVPFAPPLGPA